jgi:hypothetical protein
MCSPFKLGWGCLCIAYIGVNSKGALYAVRLCLGIVEAGFFVRLSNLAAESR